MTFKLDKLPPVIRIGAHDIEFAYLNDDDAKNDFGAFYNGDMRIALAKEYSGGSVAVETALHEVSHAILSMAGWKNELEEQICVIFGNGFAQVIRDNPKFVKWLLDTVNK